MPKPKKILSVDELISSCIEDGVLYQVIPAKSLDTYRDVFFFDADEKRIRFRELSTDEITSLTFDKFAQCQIDIDGSVTNEIYRAEVEEELSSRRKDKFNRFYFIDSKGKEQIWEEGYLVRDDRNSLIVKKSKKTKKEYIVSKNLIGEILFDNEI